jgi:dolichol kinase
MKKTRLLLEFLKNRRSRKGDMGIWMWVIIGLIISLVLSGSVLALGGDFMEALTSGAGLASVLSDLTGGLSG